MFGADDNYYADGIEWLLSTDAFGGKTNSDGTPAQMTFFITSGGGTTANGGVFDPGSVNQTEAQVIQAWQDAYNAGHEVGNHTWDHDQGNGTAGAHVHRRAMAGRREHGADLPHQQRRVPFV